MPSFFSKATSDSYFFRACIVYAAVIFALCYVFLSISNILPPFIAGLIGAYVLNRPVRKLEELKVARGLAAAMIIVAMIIVLVLVMLIALPYLQKELLLLAQALPSLATKALGGVKPLLDRISSKVPGLEIGNLKDHVQPYMEDALRWSVQVFVNLLSSGMALANALSLVVLTPIITFYLLKDWPKLIKSTYRLLPVKYAGSIVDVTYKMDRTLSAYAKGQATVCLILMVLYSIGLSLTGLPQAIFVGILTGLLSFIPFIGMLIGFMASMSLAFTHFTAWSSFIAVACVYVIIPLFEANFLTPRFIGEKIGLHPVWILFALLAGGNLFGFIGILFALPLAAIVGVLTRLLLDYYQEHNK